MVLQADLLSFSNSLGNIQGYLKLPHTYTSDTPRETWQQFSTAELIHFVSFSSAVAEETEVELNILLQWLSFYAFP